MKFQLPPRSACFCSIPDLVDMETQQGTIIRRWLDAWLRHRVMLLFLLVAGVIGGLVADDFGVNWDEKNQRTVAVKNLFIAEQYAKRVYATCRGWVFGQQPLADAGWKAEVPGLAGAEKRFLDRHYGPALEIPLYTLERLLDLEDSRSIFLLRRYLLHGIFLVGVTLLYLLAFRLSGSRGMGLMTAAFLLLHPRIYAHSFVNTKDIGFLVACIVAAFTLERFLRHPSWGRMLVHALTCAVCLDIRIIGGLPILMGMGMQFLLMLHSVGSEERRKRWQLLFVFPFLAWGFAVACWPWMWDKPIHGFLEVAHVMSQYPWKGTILFNGEPMVPYREIPWHYLPVWLGITLPPLLLLGLALWVVPKVKPPREQAFQRAFLLFCLLTVMLPPLIAIFRGSNMYNAWRQMYFIYPFLAILASWGLWRTASLWGKPWPKLLLAIQVVWMSVIMLRLHPYGDLYFNLLAGKDPELRFETDYYGFSYKEGLEYVAEHYPPGVQVLASLKVIEYAREFLPPEQRACIRFTEDPAQADVILTNYMLTEATRAEHLRRIGAEGRPEVFTVWRDGMKVLSVYGR